MSALLITVAVIFSGPEGSQGPAIPNELKPVVMGVLAVVILIFVIGKSLK